MADRRQLSCYGLTAGYVYDRAVDEARLLGGQEHEGGGEFRRLAGTSHRRLLAELGDRIARHGGGYDRRPHRTRGDDVGPQPVLHHVLGQPLGKRDYGPLGRRVGKEGGGGLVRLRGAHVDDRTTLRHVRERGLDEPEHRVDVGLEGAVQKFRRDIGYAFNRPLVGGVVDEDVYPAELVYGLLDQGLALGLLAYIPGHPHTLLAGILDHLRGLPGILFLRFEIGDQDVSTLSGEGWCDRPPDTRVATVYDGFLALQPAAAPLGIDTIVWFGPHLLLQTRMLIHLGLLRVLRLRILPGRVLLGVLTFRHVVIPPARARLGAWSIRWFLAMTCPFMHHIKPSRHVPDRHAVWGARIMGMAGSQVTSSRGGRSLWESSASSFRTSRWTWARSSPSRRTTSSSATGSRSSTPRALRGRSAGRASPSSNASPTIRSPPSSRTTRSGKTCRRGSTRTTGRSLSTSLSLHRARCACGCRPGRKGAAENLRSCSWASLRPMTPGRWARREPLLPTAVLAAL